jgi:uncharacterized coiled-coil protein SlyX
VNVSHFLDFWSHYNQTIIQALIVVTLVFIVALVFITLFGTKGEEAGSSQVGISPELEKSLQKMLENQTKAAVFDFTKPTDNAAPSSIATAGAVTPEALVQLEKLKTDMVAKEKKIAELNTQLTQATSATPAAAGGDSSKLEARIKELEARLAEYDIISEDIADLSRYKDENEKIKAELEGLKSGATAPAPVAAPPPVAAVPEPVAAPSPEPAPVPEPAQEAAPQLEVPPAEIATPEVTSPAATAETPTPDTQTAAAAPEVDSSVNAAIDDDLMKEFAAAVEGQKAATQQPAVDVPAASSDSEDLMGQFENFVQKKEGS